MARFYTNHEAIEWKPRRWRGANRQRDLQANTVTTANGLKSRKATISKNDGGITTIPDWPGYPNQPAVSDDTELNAGQAFNPDKVE